MNELEIDQIKNGFYTDHYFLNTEEVLLKSGMDGECYMQFFQKKENSILGGMNKALETIQNCALASELEVYALEDGDVLNPFEPVLTIEGYYHQFGFLETVLLGVLARGTLLATNVDRAVEAANGKPVFYFAARHDHYLVQEDDGYVALQNGVAGVSTIAQGRRMRVNPMGTIPHALIAMFNGNTVDAAKAFNDHTDQDVSVLVDFDNDCVGTTLAVEEKLGGNLKSVRLDTSEKLIDKSLQRYDDKYNRGVCAGLVINVRDALDSILRQDVQIIVSGRIE